MVVIKFFLVYFDNRSNMVYLLIEIYLQTQLTLSYTIYVERDYNSIVNVYVYSNKNNNMLNNISTYVCKGWAYMTLSIKICRYVLWHAKLSRMTIPYYILFMRHLYTKETKVLTYAHIKSTLLFKYCKLI